MFATFDLQEDQPDPAPSIFGPEAPLPRYMGSKRHLAADLVELLTPHIPPHGVLVDIGAGSGALSRAFRRHGWRVHAMDVATYTMPWNTYALMATSPLLQDEVRRYRKQHGIDDVVTWWNAILSSALDAPAYFAQHYSPSTTTSRKYFTPEVAQWLDKALHWHTTHDWASYPLLHAHFCSEVQRLMINTANCTSTLKSYHHEWGGPSNHRWTELSTIPVIGPLWVPEGPPGTFSPTEMPSEADAIVFDPPSSVHQYASCYHLLTAFIEGHYRAPAAQSSRHGSKAGILPNQYSSLFSKRATTKKAFHDWIASVQHRTSTVIVLYPPNGLLTPLELAAILQQHGNHTVTRIPLQDTYAYIVKINQPQTTAQLKKQCATLDAPKSPWSDYYEPSRLPKKYQVRLTGTKWRICNASGDPIALLNSRYKVKWLTSESLREQSDWDAAALSVENRFALHLVNKQWLAAWTCIRTQLTHSMTYREQWTMLHHLARVCGERRILHRMEKYPPCSR